MQNSVLNHTSYSNSQQLHVAGDSHTAHSTVKETFPPSQKGLVESAAQHQEEKQVTWDVINEE